MPLFWRGSRISRQKLFRRLRWWSGSGEIFSSGIFCSMQISDCEIHSIVEFLRGLGSQSGVSVWQHTLVS